MRFEQGGKQNPSTRDVLVKKLLTNNDGSVVKLSKDTVPSEDVRKKWIFTLVIGGLFYYLDKDVILNSTEFNTYDKIKGNFKYLFYYNKIILAYKNTIIYQLPRGFLIKKFDPSQSVDNVVTFYKNKLKLPPTIRPNLKFVEQLPYTQKLVYNIYTKHGMFSDHYLYREYHRISSDYRPKIQSYEQLIYHVQVMTKFSLEKYPKEPTLEDVKKHESVKYTSNCKSYKYSEKENFIKFYMKPENKSVHEETVIEKDSKQKMNKSWVIAFLLILSFTVCKKDTIDYIIEGSLWGYLIQNIARWDYISPDLM